MPKNHKKVGRPRKHASKAEKIKHDVIARRARRQFQSIQTRTHRGIRFRIYTAPQINTGLTSPPNNDRYFSRVSSLTDAPFSNSPVISTSGDQIDLRMNEVTSSNNGLHLDHAATEASSPSLEFPLLQDASQSTAQQKSARSQTKTHGQINSSFSFIDEALHCADDWAPVSTDFDGGRGDNEIFQHSDFQPDYVHQTTVTNRDVDIQLDAESLATPRGHFSTSSHGVPENLPDQEQHDKTMANKEKELDRAILDIEYLPDENFKSETEPETETEPEMETETEKETETNRLDVQYESVHGAGMNETSRSNFSIAKDFLERTWSRLCDCESQGRNGSGVETLLSLAEMARYWRNLGLPNAIDPTSNSVEVHQDENRVLDWFSILGGGESRPRLCFEKSHHGVAAIQRNWDVDSIISWASCLSINRGLYISYLAPASRNMQASVHVFHQGKPLHIIPHLRLGSGRQSPQFSVYIFFPEISHVRRTTSYLTNDERRKWIDKLLLPAIRHCCPQDVVQHHPRSFDDVESKAYSRRREACSSMVHNDIDMHHYLPEENLEAIWTHVSQSAEASDLEMFRGMFIVLSAKNIKLEAKSPTFQGCRRNITAHLHRVLNWSKADLSNTWIDVGIEDIATSGNHTFLWKRQCLQDWIYKMKNSDQSPLIASEFFNWTLTDEAGSARVEPRKTLPLHKGGIIYAQRYNINKDLFSTASKRDYGLFGEPHLEGITCPPSLLDEAEMPGW